jgi:RimJ/RimL family protein N-acetyltransferase
MINTTVATPEDMDMVRAIMAHPKVWPWISDDHSPSVESFTPSANPVITYLLLDDGEECLGLYMLFPYSATCWEIHTCLLPRGWGSIGLECAKAVLDWLFNNTPCEKLISWVPEDNDYAYKYSINAGLRLEGVNGKSVRRNGKLLDQSLFGITKESWKCLPQYQ